MNPKCGGEKEPVQKISMPIMRGQQIEAQRELARRFFFFLKGNHLYGDRLCGPDNGFPRFSISLHFFDHRVIMIIE